MIVQQERVSVLGYLVVILWLGLAIWLRDTGPQPTAEKAQGAGHTFTSAHTRLP